MISFRFQQKRKNGSTTTVPFFFPSLGHQWTIDNVNTCHHINFPSPIRPLDWPLALPHCDASPTSFSGQSSRLTPTINKKNGRRESPWGMPFFSFRPQPSDLLDFLSRVHWLTTWLLMGKGAYGALLFPHLCHDRPKNQRERGINWIPQVDGTLDR